MGSIQLAYARLVMVTALWGSTFPLTRLALVEVPPATVAVLRLGLGTVCFAVALRGEGRLTLERIREIWRLHGLQLIPLGIVGMGYYIAFINFGIAVLGAAQAGLLAPTSYPIFTAVAARLLLGDPFYPRKVIGLVTAAAGVALIIAAAVQGGLPWRPAGYLFIAMAATGFALYSVYVPHLMRTMSSLEANTWIGLFATLGVLPLAVWEQTLLVLKAAGWEFWLLVLFLSVFVQAVSYLWWCQGINVIGPSRTAVFTYLVPLWAVVLSFLILREPITAGQLVGGLLAIGGVALVNWRGSGGSSPKFAVNSSRRAGLVCTRRR